MAVFNRMGSDTKVQLLYTRLRELALEKGPNVKLPPIAELCELFSTSRSTIMDALDILESQNVVYRKPRSGIFVSPKIHRKSICVVLYSFLFLREGVSPFWGMLWGLFAQEAERRATLKNEDFNFHLVLQSPDASIALPDDVIMMIRNGKVHGMLAVGMRDQTTDWVISQHVSCVTYAGWGPCMVLPDLVEQMELAISSLVEQGCRNIGLWMPTEKATDDQTVLSPEDELRFVTALASHERLYKPELVRRIQVPAHSQQKIPTFQEQGYELVMEVFVNSKASRPDGIFIFDDMVTDGALKAFQKLGMRVGEDIKIATVANVGSPILFRDPVRMTLIEVDPANIVRTMFDTLDGLMYNHIPPEPRVLLKPKLRQHDELNPL